MPEIDLTEREVAALVQARRILADAQQEVNRARKKRDRARRCANDLVSLIVNRSLTEAERAGIQISEDEQTLYIPDDSNEDTGDTS